MHLQWNEIIIILTTIVLFIKSARDIYYYFKGWGLPYATNHSRLPMVPNAAKSEKTRLLKDAIITFAMAVYITIIIFKYPPSW